MQKVSICLSYVRNANKFPITLRKVSTGLTKPWISEKVFILLDRIQAFKCRRQIASSQPECPHHCEKLNIKCFLNVS